MRGTVNTLYDSVLSYYDIVHYIYIEQRKENMLEHNDTDSQGTDDSEPEPKYKKIARDVAQECLAILDSQQSTDSEFVVRIANDATDSIKFIVRNDL